MWHIMRQKETCHYCTWALSCYSKKPLVPHGIDFVGPITPTSVNGSCYILTISDHYFTTLGRVGRFVANTLCQKWPRGPILTTRNGPRGTLLGRTDFTMTVPYLRFLWGMKKCPSCTFEPIMYRPNYSIIVNLSEVSRTNCEFHCESKQICFAWHSAKTSSNTSQWWKEEVGVTLQLYPNPKNFIELPHAKDVQQRAMSTCVYRHIQCRLEAETEGSRRIRAPRLLATVSRGSKSCISRRPMLLTYYLNTVE